MENELNRTVDALPALVWTAFPNGRAEFVNRRWCEYTGLSVEQASGEGWQAAVHPEDLPALLQSWRTIVASGKPSETEARMRRFDGEYRWFLCRVSPITDADGKVVKWCGINSDIEDRKQTEAALRAHEERFRLIVDGLPTRVILFAPEGEVSRHSEEALSNLRAELAHLSRVNSLGTLTASIAHEISQPLAGILINASTGLRMLSAEPPNVEGALATVQRTIRDGRRASEVMTRLHALFQKKAVTTGAVDLVEASREVIELLRSEMRKRRIVLRLKAADDLPPVAGDRVQLQQVVLNLLLNAVEAMEGVDSRPRQILVKIERDDDGCTRLSVTDSGVGFDPQHASQLFDAFYTTKGEGMGIGLSVSRRIVERHGGRLWATPNHDFGATFSLSIPCGRKTATGLRGAMVQSAGTDEEQAMRSQ